MENDYKYQIIAGNYYELFGFQPFSNFNDEDLEKAYEGRFQYWRSITKPDSMKDKTAALGELIKARKILSNGEEKKRYDAFLKQKIETHLENIVKPMLKVITNYCISLGLPSNETSELLNKYIKNHASLNLMQGGD